MTNSHLIDFIRSRPAILVAVLLILVLVLGLVGGLRPHRDAAGAPLYTNSAPGATTTHLRESVPIPTVAPKIVVPIPSTIPTVPAEKPLLGIHVHVSLPPETNAPPLGLYAPAYRLLRCQTVNTVDSASIDTPIIALVTDDLWHDGRIVIPSGTEVHGKASVDRMRERIVASGPWILVSQSGEELVVNGIALDREENSSGTNWGITDGSAGLKGQILRSDSLAEIKVFASTFLSAVASGMQEQRSTVLGTETVNNVRNGMLAGTGQVMNTYAQQILETIQRDGIFVRVPAGKQMYLYITQTIDRSQAKIGNLRVGKMPASAFSQTPATKP